MLERVPNRSFKRLNLLYALDCERQCAPGFFAPVTNDRTGSLNPFNDAAAADPLQSKERIATKGETPTGWHSNVDTQKLAVNARGRVMEGRHGRTAEGSP